MIKRRKDLNSLTKALISFGIDSVESREVDATGGWRRSVKYVK